MITFGELLRHNLVLYSLLLWWIAGSLLYFYHFWIKFFVSYKKTDFCLFCSCMQRAKYDIGEEAVNRFSLSAEDRATLELAEWVDGAFRRVSVWSRFSFLIQAWHSEFFIFTYEMTFLYQFLKGYLFAIKIQFCSGFHILFLITVRLESAAFLALSCFQFLFFSGGICFLQLWYTRFEGSGWTFHKLGLLVLRRSFHSWGP